VGKQASDSEGEVPHQWLDDDRRGILTRGLLSSSWLCENDLGKWWQSCWYKAKDWLEWPPGCMVNLWHTREEASYWWIDYSWLLTNASRVSCCKMTADVVVVGVYGKMVLSVWWFRINWLDFLSCINRFCATHNFNWAVVETKQKWRTKLVPYFYHECFYRQQRTGAET
jgi:hypothetical protein